jgi:hypothetical protein
MNQCGETRRASPTAVRVYVFFIILKYHRRSFSPRSLPVLPDGLPLVFSLQRTFQTLPEKTAVCNSLKPSLSFNALKPGLSLTPCINGEKARCASFGGGATAG